METRRVSAVLATTQAIEAYGGIQFGREVMEELAKRVREGTLPMTLNHDGRRPLSVVNVESGVRERPDGEWEAWANFDVPREQWDEWHAEVEAQGAPGGMSFTVLVNRVELDGDQSSAFTAELHADAAHFTPRQVREAAVVVASRAATARAGHVYQFCYVPGATVILQFAGDLAAAIPAELMGAYLYDSLRGLLRRDKLSAPEGHVPQFEIKVEHGDRKLSAFVSTQEDSSLLEAMDKLAPLIESSEGLFNFDGDWHEVGSAATEQDGEPDD